VIAPAPGAGRQRKAAVAGLALAIFAATTLGISVYWGYRTNDTLSQRNLELATTQASLGAVQKSLTDAQSTLLHQHQSYSALKVGIKQVAEQYVATKTQLEQVQIDLGQTQGQLTQAQSQVGRAQNQLGNTQQNLSTTQSHAVQIQRGAQLLQQTVQLLASLIVLENNYITAAQGHNGTAMKSDLAQMRTLEDQAQTLEPTASPPAQ
jgi:chromosome segregation ATPase